MSTTNSGGKKKIVWIVVAVGVLGVLAALIFGGKSYMEKKETERRYQEGMAQVQQVFSEYVVQNYAGVQKIEWDGVGIEWRSGPGGEPSLFGDGVSSDFKIYVSDSHFMAGDLFLHDETDWDLDQKRFVLNGVLNPENMDVEIEVSKKNAQFRLDPGEAGAFDGFVKSPGGSPSATIIYNVVVYELTY